jgi:site-specific DNA recombinase
VKRIAGYARVSTDKQADSGVSLEDQQHKIRAMAVVHGGELVEMIVDAGESAKTLDRPGMIRLLALVDSRSVDVVIIAKLDRITRSVKDLAELLERFQKRGVALVSVAESLDTSSAAGRLVLNIMASVSQWEREAIGERTASAIRYKRSALQVFNHCPYGWKRNGKSLVAVEEEQTVIRKIRQMRTAGRKLQGIANDLNASGVPTKTGKLWQATSIRNVLVSQMEVAA